MRILEVTLPVVEAARTAAFLGQVLDLPAKSGDEPSVPAGSSILRPRQDEAAVGSDHIAFLVPADGFDDAKRRLGARVELLAHDGADEFAGPNGWNSRSVYFLGPGGLVLELIARLDLPSTDTGIVSISEVGVVVPDVRAAARDLERDAGLYPFADPAADDFAAIGDQDGLLILVPSGRAWFPTADRVSRPASSRVRAAGGARADLALGRSRLQLEPGDRAGSSPPSDRTRTPPPPGC